MYIMHRHTKRTTENAAIKCITIHLYTKHTYKIYMSYVYIRSKFQAPFYR